jgi:hypothetical protein
MDSRVLALLLSFTSVGHVVALAAGPTITPHPILRRQGHDAAASLAKRVTSELSTCGYYDGDPTKPRTANSGFDCRVDTLHGLWGFCPTTVIVATDCGLAGNCVDSHACSTGCGIANSAIITTFTWYVTAFCNALSAMEYAHDNVVPIQMPRFARLHY